MKGLHTALSPAPRRAIPPTPQRVDVLRHNDVASGSSGGDEETPLNRLITFILDNAVALFGPTEQIDPMDLSIHDAGTGFTITPDGFMVTAAHAASKGEDQILRLAVGFSTYVFAYANTHNANRVTCAEMRINSGGVGQNRKPVPAEIVDVDESYLGRGVALIQAAGYNAIPTVALATEV